MVSSDEQDVAAVLAGDVNRFEGIVRRWQTPLVNLAWRYVRDAARAEELAQEAFLKCFRSLHQWRHDAEFSTWLFAIAMSVYSSQVRRFQPVFEALDEALADSRAAPDRLAGDEERREAVRRAVAALPSRYRDPLIVFYFQEEDLASTAAILGLRDGTLKARLHRAREKLRETLEDISK